MDLRKKAHANVDVHVEIKGRDTVAQSVFPKKKMKDLHAAIKRLEG